MYFTHRPVLLLLVVNVKIHTEIGIQVLVNFILSVISPEQQSLLCSFHVRAKASSSVIKGNKELVLVASETKHQALLLLSYFLLYTIRHYCHCIESDCTLKHWNLSAHFVHHHLQFKITWFLMSSHPPHVPIFLYSFFSSALLCHPAFDILFYFIPPSSSPERMICY